MKNNCGDSTLRNYYFPKFKLLIQLVEYEWLTKRIDKPNLFQEHFMDASRQQCRLLNIWEDRWILKRNLVESSIRNYLGINQKISARTCTVEKLDKQQTDLFFNQNHIQGATGYAYKTGLFHKNKLVAAIAFSKSRIMLDGPNLYRSYELVRFSNLLNYTVVGGLGKLLKHFLDQKHAKHIMTYIDLDYGTGDGFIKLGFKKSSYTDPILFRISKENQQRTYLKNAKLNDEIFDEKSFIGINAGNLKLIRDSRTF